MRKFFQKFGKTPERTKRRECGAFDVANGAARQHTRRTTGARYALRHSLDCTARRNTDKASEKIRRRRCARDRPKKTTAKYRPVELLEAQSTGVLVVYVLDRRL